ncbi:sigma-70 family RNA polymerase sigma factor [Sphingomonas sp. PAMC 26605]|uniref:sigma-70 family RNA polymerase sigma factor n=1 Tax=Sphingomonas sp. PAMC 26605 TaxID=1112214 RepID=UPI00026CB5D2|nr:sigma-70 family RNA polymerase sigma factor [Sphingomonas sp. PAMC 26605]
MATSEAELKMLMIGGLDGDAAAHGRLLRALVPLLQSFYRRRLSQAEDVDDLVQDTLIALHIRRETFDRDRPFTAWLYAIARYRAIDHYRRRRSTVPIEDVESILVAEGFEDAANARIDVNTLLSTLSTKQARAIRDTHLYGKSVSEAAAGADVGESDVKVSVHRGLKALSALIRGL